jgi:hypothetical protein
MAVRGSKVPVAQLSDRPTTTRAGWCEEDSLSSYCTQAGGEEAGRAVSKDERIELFVHSHTGQIRDRSTYGHDPRGIPG